jgi:UDP-glucose 4-epimerase
MTERVLITGGAGLIGSHLADEIVRSTDWEIVVLDNFTRGRPENLAEAVASGRVRLREGDVRNESDIARAMDGVSVVFHQAAIRITQCADEPRLAKDVLVDGSFNLLEAAVRMKVRKVVAASTASVYGAAEAFPTRESHHPYGNRTLYGAAKLFNEGLLRSFNDMYGLDYVALRYFNVYGPRMDIFGAYTEVFIRWMDAIAAGKPPVIFGDGTQSMDFVHVADVARANVLALDGEPGVYNVATGIPRSVFDMAAALAAAVPGAPAPRVTGEFRRGDVRHVFASPRRARERLGFDARIGLEEGMRELAIA